MTTAPGGGGVLITLEAIYNQLIALTTRVDAALSRHERVELMVAEHDAELRPLTGAAERLHDHEARLRAVERRQWPLASIAVLLPIAAIAVTILVAIYKK